MRITAKRIVEGVTPALEPSSVMKLNTTSDAEGRGLVLMTGKWLSSLLGCAFLNTVYIGGRDHSTTL